MNNLSQGTPIINACRNVDEVKLKVSEWGAIVKVLENILPCSESYTVHIQDNQLRACVANGLVFIHADLSGIIKPIVNMTVINSKKTIKKLKQLTEGEDVYLKKIDNNLYISNGITSHTLNMPNTKKPEFIWDESEARQLGFKIDDLNLKVWQRLIGSATSIRLQVFNEQLESISLPDGTRHFFYPATGFELMDSQPTAEFMSSTFLKVKGIESNMRIFGYCEEYWLVSSIEANCKVNVTVYEVLRGI